MQPNKESPDIDKGVCVTRQKEVKTTTEYSVNSSLGKHSDDDLKKKILWCDDSTVSTFIHFFTLFGLGLLTWGLLWSAWGEGWSWNGEWFRLAGVAVVAWSSGQVLQAVTGLPPLLAALLTGIFARHLDILNMRHYTHIDGFLRKIYPVIILGKASLSWNLTFMKSNWRLVAALGVLPWCVEVVTLAICTKLIFGFPWIWGFLLGSIYASVSCAVVMPSVQSIGARADGGSRNWAQLVCTAGGTDTALSVGVYGLIYSYMFFDAHYIYRCVKAGLTLFAGVALGIMWGSLAGLVPHSRDFYVSEMRVLFVLLGGLFGNFFTSNIGWGGTAGVAVLACNATAAFHWARDGWTLNKNPASTAYRVMWAAFEPILFAYTGTFFELNAATSKTMLYGLAVLLICLTTRLIVTALVCWDMTLKERMFVCCTWIPKSIVEAVLCPVAINTLSINPQSKNGLEIHYAENVMRLIVQAILITTPIGFLLTHHLGPWLLRKSQENANDQRSST